MNELSLFSGVGGGLLATQHLLGWKAVGYVEWDEYCCRVLEQRIKDGFLHDAPIWQMDIREFNSQVASQYKGMVDVVTAGFPCQPFSVAGKKLGEDDERNMWPATLEALCIIRPRYAYLENVPGLLAASHGYFGTILQGLAEAGYDARWTVLGADDVCAPHRRKRLWVLANTPRQRWRGRDNDDERRMRGSLQTKGPCSADKQSSLAHPKGYNGGNGSQRQTDPEGSFWRTEHQGGGGLQVRTKREDRRCTWWDQDPAEGPTKPVLDRVANGVSGGLDFFRVIKEAAWNNEKNF